MVKVAKLRYRPGEDHGARREMTVFGHPGVGFRPGKMIVAAQQVFPVDYEAEVSQRLVESVKRGDLRAVMECLADPFVDVNYAAGVSLKIRQAVMLLRVETADEVKIEYEELRTDVSALFLAAHSGDLQIARKLLDAGADVNQRLFRGFALTAAAREGHADVAELLLKSGASQLACEEALMEACCHGRVGLVELLMASELIRPRIAVHALVLSASRGFGDVVDSLIKWGVDANSKDRILLRSAKPPLHTNADCSPLIAAIISRQISIVQKLLEVGVDTKTEVRLGGWSWDSTGEEVRVGAGLAEPYDAAWCAVEYFESTGSILRLLLQHHPPNALHNRRALLHHAVLCSNLPAVDLLLQSCADPDLPSPLRPIHLAAKLGRPDILRRLLSANCELNSRSTSGDTPLTLAAVNGQRECLKILGLAGADFGLVNHCQLSKEKKDLLEGVMLELTLEKGGPTGGFFALHCAARRGDTAAVARLIASHRYGVNAADVDGHTPLMLAAREGHVSICRLLISSGALCDITTSCGETALSLAKAEPKEIILNELARVVVTRGARVKKHTKGGKGRPHWKTLRMVPEEGVLKWGDDTRRNVVCYRADVGPSPSFLKNRKGKADAVELGLFRVQTVAGREVHFVCLSGGDEEARLWVRGILLLSPK